MTVPIAPVRGPSALTERLAERTGAPSDIRIGRVTEVTAYGVTVDVAGGQVPASYLDSYAPAVGHTVVLQRFLDAWTVIGRPVGSGTPTDGATAGSGVGLTELAAIRTEGGGTIASSTGADIPVPGYTLTFHHPVGHSVLFLLGYSWYSTQSADWFFGHIREATSGGTISEWVEPIISNSFGRYGTWPAVAGPSYGGQKRTYYMTMARLSGTGTTTVSKNDANKGFFIALDLGDQSFVGSA